MQNETRHKFPSYGASLLKKKLRIIIVEKAPPDWSKNIDFMSVEVWIKLRLISVAMMLVVNPARKVKWGKRTKKKHSDMSKQIVEPMHARNRKVCGVMNSREQKIYCYAINDRGET